MQETNLNLEEKMQNLPRPYPDRKFWDENLAAGFRQYPQREENYKKFKSAEKTEVLDYLPIRLDIENVSRCNFRCTMCQVSLWDKGMRAKDMSFDDFKKLLDEQYGLIEIKLQGMGEPLLGKDDYFNMIKYARERFIWVRTTTNASLLHINDNYKRLIDSGICEIQVSIDGATKETYETIRKGGKFELLKKNCKLLNDYSKSKGKSNTRMWFVAQKSNFHELEQLPVLAGELGFERMTISLDLNDWADEKWKNIIDEKHIHQQINLERAENVVEIGKQNGVEVTFWFIDEKYDLKDKEKLCPWPFERAYVASDMKAVPCCMIANPEIIDLGKIDSFTEVWNNKAFQDFRKAHLEGNIPSYCRACYK